MRAFFAIPIPEHIKRCLVSLQLLLSESRADVKWVKADHLHITLKFLDEITSEQKENFAHNIRTIGELQGPLTIGLSKLGAFTSLKSPRVIWVGIDQGESEVVHLAQSIEQICRSMKLHGEERSFAAHVTLGRVKSRKNRFALTKLLQNVEWSPPGSFVVERLILYQSTLNALGPTHSPLCEFKLG